MKLTDDDMYLPQQFGLGSLYDLKDPPPGRTPRLAGLRSVRNLQGGIVHGGEAVTDKPLAAYLSPPVLGFHRPPSVVRTDEPQGTYGHIIGTDGKIRPLIKAGNPDLQAWLDRVFGKK